MYGSREWVAAFKKNEDSDPTMDRKLRREIYEQISSCAEFIRENRIANVLLLDRSARPLGFALTEYYDKMYSHEKPPQIFVTNPAGYSSEPDSVSFSDIFGILQSLEKGEPLPGLPRRSIEHIAQDFTGKYPLLMAQRDKPLLLFDTCVHTGETMEPVLAVLEYLGFTDIRIGVGSMSHLRGPLPFRVDYVGPRGQVLSCHPFGVDSLASKTRDSVVSSPSTSKSTHDAAMEWRGILADIIEENLHKSGS
jgi:hypothetical protein